MLRKKLIFICLLMFGVLAGGCAPESMNATPGAASAPPSAQASADPQIAEQSADPNRLEGKLGESIVLDASIQAPEQVPPVLHMEELPFDDAVLSKAFFGAQPPPRWTRKTLDGSGNEEVSYHYEPEPETVKEIYEAGKPTLAVYPSCFSYRKPVTDYSLPLWKVDWITGGGPEHTYGQVYRDEDLDGFPKADAIQAIRTLLETAGVQLYGKPEVVAMDRATMQAWQDDALAKDKTLYAEIDQGNIAYKKTLTTDDEAYAMRFQAAARGIPVARVSYVQPGSELTYQSPDITAKITRQGVVSCYAGSVYREKGEETPDHPLLTAREAAGKMQARLEGIIGANSYTVLHASMEYAPAPWPGAGNLEINYVPAWVFSAKKTNQMQKGEAQSAENDNITIVVNAVTGEIIG